jgi:hypothetical protein
MRGVAFRIAHMSRSVECIVPARALIGVVDLGPLDKALEGHSIPVLRSSGHGTLAEVGKFVRRKATRMQIRVTFNAAASPGTYGFGGGPTRTFSSPRPTRTITSDHSLETSSSSIPVSPLRGRMSQSVATMMGKTWRARSAEQSSWRTRERKILMYIVWSPSTSRAMSYWLSTTHS